MIDVYEIKFKDQHFCKIKVCQEDPNGQELPESSVCFLYNELWDSAVRNHVENFIRKHPKMKSFDEYKDKERFVNVYKFIAEDGSRLQIDAIPAVQDMEIIKKLKKL